MQVANVSVPINYAGVTDEFFRTVAVVPQARDAQHFAVAELKKSF